jgi:hypothetical protein
MGWETIVKEELGSASNEDSLHAVLDGFESAAGEFGNDVSERDPADDAFADDRVGEGSISGIEVLDFWLDGMEFRIVQRMGTENAISGVPGIARSVVVTLRVGFWRMRHRERVGVLISHCDSADTVGGEFGSNI